MQADESLIHPSVNLILGVVIEHLHVHKQTTVNKHPGKTRRTRSLTKPFQIIVGTICRSCLRYHILPFAIQFIYL